MAGRSPIAFMLLVVVLSTFFAYVLINEPFTRIIWDPTYVPTQEDFIVFVVTMPIMLLFFYAVIKAWSN